MFRDEYLALLKEESGTLLETLTSGSELSAIICGLLETFSSKIVRHDGHTYHWPLLPMMVCKSVSGYADRASPASVAVLFLMAAADVFDDIEDQDSTDSLVSTYGFPQAVNVATTLLILAEQSILRLVQKGICCETVVNVAQRLNSHYTTACLGQHRDLVYNHSRTISEDDYLSIASMKSGAQAECACNIGALLADADDSVTGIFAQFGQDLGVAGQIANDIKGIIDLRDIKNKIITLPVIYALSQTGGELNKIMDRTCLHPEVSVQECSAIKDLLLDTGAVHYSLIKMELYIEKAKDSLLQLESQGVNIALINDMLNLFDGE